MLTYMSSLGTTSSDTTQLANDVRIVVGRLVRRLRATRKADDLTMAEESVLSRIERDGPLGGGDIAKLEGVKPQAISTILAKLQEKSLISREQDVADGRRTLISATATGRELLSSRRTQWSRQMARAIERTLDENEQRRLHDAINLLDRVMENM
jgi:DNA-binding MarR family transcriptional regulator